MGLLGAYFLILTLVSGWEFTWDQFLMFWPFLIALAAGFGIQVGLYFYLKHKVNDRNGSKGVMVVTGSTSTVAMVSCCVHYLVNILPILGVTGLVTFVAHYQIELFWVGILFNGFGIFYIVRKIFYFNNSHV